MADLLSFNYLILFRLWFPYVIKRENEGMCEQFENDQFLQEVIFQEANKS